MSRIMNLKKKVLDGMLLDKNEIQSIINGDIDELIQCADEIRAKMCGSKFSLCTIINGKSGRCSENCRYCAQSVHFKTNVSEYELLDDETIAKSAKSNYSKGVHKFSIVTSGKRLTKAEVDSVAKCYQRISEECDIELCASHGLLSYEDLKKLKDSGVTRYHNNLETSRNYFSKICTTHTYDEKIETIKAALKAGLEVCSGGIIGMGESMEDRIDMAFTLRELKVNSVPVNILNPVKGTPLENMKPLSYEEICRTIALFRFILPNTQIRLAGGRALLNDKGAKAFKSGINAAISGDMLTTCGIKTEEDIELIKSLGFEV
ncbi:biotin synthase BioB [uncultured Clostridium sp.]|uniref:biotin synthase BioB n=1 Tax=uncultured Clostridium sp. TaxID=59620 RepID=UPI0025DAC0AF|nr:biotin synthase BioB [uncultured Clostridium sp.]